MKTFRVVLIFKDGQSEDYVIEADSRTSIFSHACSANHGKELMQITVVEI